MKEFAPKKQSEWQILRHLAALNPRFHPLTPTLHAPPRMHTSGGHLWLPILLQRRNTALLPPGPLELGSSNEFKWGT